VVVFRFARIDQLTAWLDSGTRRELLDEGSALFEGVPTQDVLAGQAPGREVVTVVISHQVRRGRAEEFVRWQDKVLKAQQEYAGFMGSELFPPVRGVQGNWVVVFRFDTRHHLDEWLDSPVRARLLREGGDYVYSYDMRKVGSSFSSWFRFDRSTEEGVPPNWKQAASVVLALYPTVMVLNLTVGRVFTNARVPGFLGLFISNLLSVSILTWLLMPLVNRVFAFWLPPSRARTPRIHLMGAALVALCYAVLLAIFGLTVPAG
jgi:antibiotic biosynthesis monooxygenase (ABM) superfamily enzyme